jgi:hypothetical protein
MVDVPKGWHAGSMEMRHRHAELLSPDAKLRLAIHDRADQRFQLVEERVRSYEAGDEYNPDILPFPVDASWEPFWVIHSEPRDGLYDTIEDALREARCLLMNGS